MSLPSPTSPFPASLTPRYELRCFAISIGYDSILKEGNILWAWANYSMDLIFCRLPRILCLAIAVFSRKSTPPRWNGEKWSLGCELQKSANFSGLCRNDGDGLWHKSRHCWGNLFEGREIPGGPDTGVVWDPSEERTDLSTQIDAGQQDTGSGWNPCYPRCWRSQPLWRLSVMLPGNSHDVVKLVL